VVSGRKYGFCYFFRKAKENFFHFSIIFNISSSLQSPKYIHYYILYDWYGRHIYNNVLAINYYTYLISQLVKPCG